MFPQKKRAMIAWLQAQPMPGHLKVQILSWWARWVGIRLKAQEFLAVERTGV